MLAPLILALALAGQPDIQPEDPPLLGGPEISQAQLRSLVQQGMTQGFVRIEGRPELAAARLLDLDTDTLEQIRKIEEDRGIGVVMMLIDRIDDLRKMTDATTAGDTAKAQQILRSLWEDYDQDTTLLPVLKRMEEVLTKEQFAETTRLAEEYTHAWTQSEKQKDESQEQTQQRLAFTLFQQEIQEAYQASLRTTQQALQGIYDAVDPTPKQHEQIRTIVIEHVKRTRLNPESHERRETMREIYDMLDEKRRGMLFDYAMRIVVPD